MQRIASIILVVFALAATSSALQCYVGPDPNGNVNPTTAPDSNICISYQFKCTDGDTLCTTQEQKDGTQKTAYIYNTQAMCDTMKTTPGYSNVACCNTDLCNAPSKSFGSIIVPSIALLAGAVALGL